nr:SH3 domain-containing C40 family peptidase [Asaia platycodi]
MRNRVSTHILRSSFLIIPLVLAACQSGPDRSPQDTARLNPDYIDPTKSVFPLTNYSQSVDQWILAGADPTAVLIDAATQQRYFAALKSQYFGMGDDGHSPWNPVFVGKLLAAGVESTRDWGINAYLGAARQSWGQNFRTHDDAWKNAVRDNAAVDIDNGYHAANRGIALRETLVRVLPTDDPAYNDPRKAGEGYPFDNLQMSSVRPGTPVYTLTVSRDHRWRYVVSPDVTGWVHYEDIAQAREPFVNSWVKMASAHLGAATRQPVSIFDDNVFHFTARSGTVLPSRNAKSGVTEVAIPVSDATGHAQIAWYADQDQAFAPMPLAMNRTNIAMLVRSLVNRPYGWGNYNFYNDCSAELRSLLIPFGILMPRNSLAQIQATSRTVDLGKADVETRLDYLVKNGKPFTTLIHIPGHIMMYIGNTTVNGQTVPMTYQDVWGLRPKDADGRSIIGGSVFFPLMKSYPENTNLQSLAGKTKFEVGFIE